MDLLVSNAFPKGYAKLTMDEKEWGSAEKNAYGAKYKELNSILCPLSLDEFRQIFDLEMTKEA